jgi:hypothetical protein
MARLFPNLSFNYGLQYDTDKYLVDSNWNEAGLQLSFNLLNLLTAPRRRSWPRPAWRWPTSAGWPRTRRC